MSKVEGMGSFLGIWLHCSLPTKSFARMRTGRSGSPGQERTPTNGFWANRPPRHLRPSPLTHWRQVNGAVQSAWTEFILRRASFLADTLVQRLGHLCWPENLFDNRPAKGGTT